MRANNPYKILGIMVTIVFISDSCQGQDVTKATKIGVEKTVLPISQLQGKYNAVEDIWENQGAAYE